MSKRLYGGSSDSKTARYAKGAATSARNKLRKMAKHIKRHPNDLQTKGKL